MESAPRTLARRLHAISGVVPVGAFLAFHLFVNASAARGPDAYNATARRLQQFPVAVLIETVVIVLPLVFHGVYGLFVIAAEPPGAAHPGPAGRVLSVFQRVTGVFLFAFILFHLWTTRLIQVRDHEDLDLFRLMQAALASPWIHALYVAGILSAAGHLSAGLWSFSRLGSLAGASRARGAVAIVAVAVFVLLSAVGLRSLAAFRL